MIHEDDIVEEAVPEVHPDQIAIPVPNFPGGDIGPCYWCTEHAVYGGIDIGLPKRPGQPRTLVRACAHHYRYTILPELVRRDREQQRKRLRVG